jgi:probable F420-dependent oxidoreductase
VSSLPYDKYPVRIAVQIQPQAASYAELRRVAWSVEELGADALMNWDHFFSQYGSAEDRHYECWTMLAAWAEATSRIELGPLVACTAYRNPDLLADMARTVDHISGGRVILGLGSGWYERDFAEYGFEFGTAASRADQLDDALSRVKKRFARLNPPPLRAMPILIGGNGEKRTLRSAAMHADIWHGFGDPAVLAEKNRVLDEWCVRLGRDPGEIERSTRVVRRSPEEVGDDLTAVGMRLITLVARSPEFDLGYVRDWLAYRDDFNKDRPASIAEDVTTAS